MDNLFLVFDIDTKKNPQQEEIFSEQLNLELFFASEKIIFGIESWKQKNLIKLLKNINNNKITLYYSRWNENLSLIYSHLLSLKNFSSKIVNDSISQQLFLDYQNKAYLQLFLKYQNCELHQKFTLFWSLLSIWPLTLNDFKLINESINNNLLSFDIIFNFLFFKYTKNETRI